MAKARRASKEVVAVARSAAADARSMFGKEGRAARRAAKRAAKAAAAQQVLAKEVAGGRQSAAKQAAARSSPVPLALWQGAGLWPRHQAHHRRPPRGEGACGLRSLQALSQRLPAPRGLAQSVTARCLRVAWASLAACWQTRECVGPRLVVARTVTAC
jgi:hypothetical protein